LLCFVCLHGVAFVGCGGKNKEKSGYKMAFQDNYLFLQQERRKVNTMSFSPQGKWIVSENSLWQNFRSV